MVQGKFSCQSIFVNSLQYTGTMYNVQRIVSWEEYLLHFIWLCLLKARGEHVEKLCGQPFQHLEKQISLKVL
jgi:hypothetical protein